MTLTRTVTQCAQERQHPCKNVGVENSGDAWHRATAARIGKAVGDRRRASGMTAQQLAERCAQLGVPIHRTTITKIENGRPRFDLGELMVLAAALDVAPVSLIYPDLPDGEVEALPGEKVSSIVALLRFTGEFDRVAKSEPAKLARLSRELFEQRVSQKGRRRLLDELVADVGDDSSDEQVDKAARMIEHALDKADEIRELKSQISEIPGSVVDDDA